MKNTGVVCGLALIALGAIAQTAAAKESPIKRETLPSAVEQALSARYPGAEVRGLTRDAVKSTVLYEAEMIVDGHHVDALFDAKGVLREEEIELPVSELPAPVRAAVAHSAHSHAVIRRAERVSDGTTTAAPRYELLLIEGAQHFEFVYGADGRLMSGKKTDAND